MATNSAVAESGKGRPVMKTGPGQVSPKTGHGNNANEA